MSYEGVSDIRSLQSKGRIIETKSMGSARRNPEES